MPRSIRFFPVNHDINADPEVWELTDKFGDRALRVWLEVLSIADRNYGKLDGSLDGWVGVLMRVYSTGNPRWIRRDTESLQSCLRWMSEKGWIRLRERSEGDQKAIRERSEGDQKALVSGSEPLLEITNYAKYHKVRGENSSPPNLTYPNLTKPIKNIAQSQKDSGSMRMMNLEFPDDWKWLEEFIKRNPLNNNFPTDRFLDFAWWDAVSYRCGGLSQDFVEREFAGIRRWIMDNPGREPTPRGYRKFVAGWLERAYEKERRFNPNGKKA